jgi:hypothetical protein
VNSQAHDSFDGQPEVPRIVDICYGDPSKTGKLSLSIFEGNKSNFSQLLAIFIFFN